MIKVRFATAADAVSILNIYKPYITDTAITFETEIPSIASFQQRIIDCLETWPWLVCDCDGVIAGYAYATKHRERAAYQWCVESSVYIDNNFQKKGLATKLYRALFKILKYQGFINVYAGITLPNEKSIAFHKNFGFSKIAAYANIGFKMNQWNTVSWWERPINEYPQEPNAPVKLSAINQDILQDLIEEKNSQ